MNDTKPNSRKHVLDLVKVFVASVAAGFTIYFAQSYNLKSYIDRLGNLDLGSILTLAGFVFSAVLIVQMANSVRYYDRLMFWMLVIFGFTNVLFFASEFFPICETIL